MPRTPLMRALKRAANDHALAKREGIDYDTVLELREKQWEAALDRRNFLKRAGAVGAGLAIGGATFATPAFAKSGDDGPAAAAAARGRRQPRIVIVGAGIAGLTAALSLKDAGVNATVYEASTRIGGRMHSDASGYWSNGQVSEWGGELIDTGHDMIQALAARFGFALDDLPGAEPRRSTDTYYFNGRYYSVDKAAHDFGPVQAALDADNAAASYPTTYNQSTPAGVALDNMSVYDWIESRVPGGHHSTLGQLLDVAYAEEYGADTRDQSALNIVYLLGTQDNPNLISMFGASDERFHVRGGNDQIPLAIAASLGDERVITGYKLTRIASNRDGTQTLTFDTGHGRPQTITADHTIVTIPFPALKNVDTSAAGFDSLKQQTITQLGAGRSAKLQLQFAARYWNFPGRWGQSSTGSSFSDTGAMNTWEVTRGQQGATGILNNFTGGSIAAAFTPSTAYSHADNPQVTGYAQQFLRQIENVYPGISRFWTGKASLSVPPLDPNLGLSYSYWRVGQYHTISGYEGVRQGNIHFAGEHCSQDFQGYMEGGAEEGDRAASEILTDLGLA